MGNDHNNTISIEGPADSFYATLKKLGCVKCPECGGSYMLPDHTTHRTLLDPLTAEPAVETVAL
jgi:hypothetical protein